jgi:hypothetical protein
MKDRKLIQKGGNLLIERIVIGGGLKALDMTADQTMGNLRTDSLIDIKAETPAKIEGEGEEKTLETDMIVETEKTGIDMKTEEEKTWKDMITEGEKTGIDMTAGTETEALAEIGGVDMMTEGIEKMTLGQAETKLSKESASNATHMATELLIAEEMWCIPCCPIRTHNHMDIQMCMSHIYRWATNQRSVESPE